MNHFYPEALAIVAAAVAALCYVLTWVFIDRPLKSSRHVSADRTLRLVSLRPLAYVAVISLCGLTALSFYASLLYYSGENLPITIMVCLLGFAAFGYLTYVAIWPLHESIQARRTQL